MTQTARQCPTEPLIINLKNYTSIGKVEIEVSLKVDVPVVASVPVIISYVF